MGEPIFNKVKRTLRQMNVIAFDQDIVDLIEAAQADLGVAGVTNTDDTDPLVIRAIETYCKLNFGDPDNADRLQNAYNDQKAQMSTNSNYTTWEADE